MAEGNGMVERAAKALWDTGRSPSMHRWDQRNEIMKDETRGEARAALIAALDPDDEALVDEIAIAAFGSYGDATVRAHSKAVVFALRAKVKSQGEMS